MANRPTLDLPLESIESNTYNPNMMSPEEYEALKESVKTKTVDPIIVAPKDIFYGDNQFDPQTYVIVDGENRWKAAKEVGLKTILSSIWAVKEGEARAITYKRNRERGNIDPVKEAKLFALEVEGGMSRSDVARKYGVAPSQVTQRLKLVDLDEETIELFRRPKEAYKEIAQKQYEEEQKAFEEQVKELETDLETSQPELDRWKYENQPTPPDEDIEPEGVITASHLELLASIDDEQRRLNLRNRIIERGLSVRDTEQQAASIKKDLERELKLHGIVSQAKRPTCPNCSGEPDMYNNFENNKLRCGDCYHWWDSSLSEEEYEAIAGKQPKTDRGGEREPSKWELDEKARQVKARAEAAANPGYVKRAETPDEIGEKLRPYLTKLITTFFTNIKECNIEGLLKDGNYANIELKSRNIHVKYYELKKPGEMPDYPYNACKSEHSFGFYMEPKNYKRGGERSRLDLSHETSPLGRAKIHHLLNTMWLDKEAKWPWADDEHLEAAVSIVTPKSEPEEDEEEPICEQGFTVSNALTECDKRIQLEEEGEGCQKCRYFLGEDKVTIELSEEDVEGYKELSEAAQAVHAEHAETPNESWILHCSVDDVNWKQALGELTMEEVDYCLTQETRKTAVQRLKARKNKLLAEE